MPLVPLAVNHTDAGPGNAVLTPTGQAIPIHLESACIAPADLDLENLFRYQYFLADQDASNHLAIIGADLLNRPGAEARLRGYAVLRDLWALRRWFRQTPEHHRPVDLRTAPTATQPRQRHELARHHLLTEARTDPLRGTP